MKQATFYLLFFVGLHLSAGDQCQGPAADATPTGPALDASSGVVMLATKSVVAKRSLVTESEDFSISAMLQELTGEMHNFTSLTQKSNAGLALASELAFDSVVSLVSSLGNGTNSTLFIHAISRVRTIINDTMRATIQGAHDRDVQELATLSTTLGQCYGEHLNGSQLATLTDFKNQALASTHKTCRAAEGVVATNKATCDADVASKKSIKDTQCAVPATLLRKTAQQYYNEWAPNVGEGTKDYIDRMKITINSKHTEITAAQRACTNATTNHSSAASSCSATNTSLTTKKQSCDTAQEQLEEHTCNWRKVAGSMCDGYTGCHATRSASLTEAIRIITGNVQDRKAEWKGLARIDCLLDAFADGTINQTEIDTCKGLTHSAAAMNITIPVVPTPTNCTSTYPVIPCSAQWVKQEYSNLPANAPAKDCSPCQLGPAPPTPFGKSDKMPDCTNSKSLFAADYMGITDAAVTPATTGHAGECGFSMQGNKNAVLAYPLEEGSAFTSVTCTIYDVPNEYGMTLLVDGETPTPRTNNENYFLATCQYSNKGVEGWLDGCIGLHHNGQIIPYAKTPSVQIGGRWDTGGTRTTLGTSSQWKKLTIKLEGGKVIFSYATEASGGAEKVLKTFTAPHTKFYVGLSSAYGIQGSTCVMNPGVAPTTPAPAAPPAPTTTPAPTTPAGPVAAFGTSDKLTKCTDPASELASDYKGWTDAQITPGNNGDCSFNCRGGHNAIMAHPMEDGGFYDTITCKLYGIPNSFGMVMLVDGVTPDTSANGRNLIDTCVYANHGLEYWLDGCIYLSHNGQILPYAQPSSGTRWDQGGAVRVGLGTANQYKKVRMVAKGGKVQFSYAVELNGGAFTQLKEWTPPSGHSKWYIALSANYGISGATCQMSKSQVPTAV